MEVKTTTFTTFNGNFRKKRQKWVMNYLQDCLECDGTQLDELDYLAAGLSGMYDVRHRNKEMVFRSSETKAYPGQTVEIKIVRE